MIRTLLAKIKGEATFLVLLAVAGVGAWLYVQFRQVTADRDDLRHRADVICARASTDFAPDKGTRGVACAAQVGALAGFKAHAAEESARTLAAALAEHDRRQLTDFQAARAAAEAARTAAQKMEAADAEAERRNIVDREWFAAVNGVAGLRAATRR